MLESLSAVRSNDAQSQAMARKTSKGIKISIRGTKETEVLDRSKRKTSHPEGCGRSCHQLRVMLRACCYCKRPIALNIRSMPALPFSAVTEVTVELPPEAAYHTSVFNVPNCPQRPRGRERPRYLRKFDLLSALVEFHNIYHRWPPRPPSVDTESAVPGGLQLW